VCPNATCVLECAKPSGKQPKHYVFAGECPEQRQDPSATCAQGVATIEAGPQRPRSPRVMCAWLCLAPRQEPKRRMGTVPNPQAAAQAPRVST